MYAIRKDRLYLLWAALFLSALTRPVAMLLIPVFLIMEVITNERKSLLHALWHFAYKYAFPLVAGTAFFIWYQHHETGVWFAFFKQEKNWGHEIHGVHFPFGSTYGPKLLWLNAIALFVGLWSLVWLFICGFRWLLRNTVQQDRLWIVSLLYLGGMALEIILFNPHWGIERTNIYDLLRYAFVTPFFWVFLHKVTQQRVGYNWKEILLVVLASNVLASCRLLSAYNDVRLLQFLYGAYRVVYA